MSGFQRFVTYINLYEKNSKIRNVGFARVERQNEQCRIEIHMRGTGYTGISCPVHLFIRKDDKMEGVLIGKLQMINGSGDGRFLLEGGNLGGSGFDLAEAGGFLIFVNERVMFASQWDDKEICREQFEAEEVWKARKEQEEKRAQEERQAQAKREEEEKKAREQKQAEEARRRTGNGNRQNFRTVQRSGQPSNQNLQFAGQQRVQEAVKPVKESLEIPQPQPANSAPTASPTAQPALEVKRRPAGESMEAPKERKAEPELEQPRSADVTTQIPQERKAEPEQPHPAEESIHAAEAEACLKQPGQQQMSWPKQWQFILENYPVLTPFEGEDDILCVRLDLKDLRILPKRHWYLGNNSFLLHGFFNYRYLILGAMEQDGVKRWFIGVPGVFQSQEKVMAAIFGFTEYKSEKTAQQKTNEFGYWYRFLE